MDLDSLRMDCIVASSPAFFFFVTEESTRLNYMRKQCP